MKKEYEQPKIEKFNFEYANNVVASGMDVVNGKNHGHGCGDPRDVSHWDNPGHNKP